MSVLTQTPPPAAVTAGPTPRRWTRAEYYRLGELDFFRGQRVERIGGELMVMSPQDWKHTAGVTRADTAVRAAFAASGRWVRTQFPMEFTLESDPEPDVSVVPGRFEDYRSHPDSALLIVEVANTSLSYDRREKASLYAAAGVPDYWVLDVNGRRLEVCRDPRPDPDDPHGWGYADRRWLAPGDSVAPLAAPAASVSVGGLLS